MPIVRTAKNTDVPQITDIYSSYDFKPVDINGYKQLREALEAWFNGRNNNYPFLVLEENLKICGFAYVVRSHTKSAPQNAVEMVIFLRKDTIGQGYGKTLYLALASMLREQNCCNMGFQ